VESSLRTLNATANNLLPSITFWARAELKKMSSEELEEFKGDAINLNFGNFVAGLTHYRSLFIDFY
jgi:hypothetical protein